MTVPIVLTKRISVLFFYSWKTPVNAVEVKPIIRKKVSQWLEIRKIIELLNKLHLTVTKCSARWTWVPHTQSHFQWLKRKWIKPKQKVYLNKKLCLMIAESLWPQWVICHLSNLKRSDRTVDHKVLESQDKVVCKLCKLQLAIATWGL